MKIGKSPDLSKRKAPTVTPSTVSEGESLKPLTVVVGFDFSDADGAAFDQAARIARRAPSSVLHLIHVFDLEPSQERSRDLVARLRLHVNEKAAILGGLRGMTVGIHLRYGNAPREIVQLATEVGADMIVVGSRRGLHLKHWIVGSTAHRLIALARCPVLVSSPWPRDRIEPHEPVIEPPCPECVRTRAATGGSRWWCERHSHRSNGAHTYSYQQDVPFASHDSQVFPTGIDL
jgi:nucleotide-binding universal stress UspA family protein